VPAVLSQFNYTCFPILRHRFASLYLATAPAIQNLCFQPPDKSKTSRNLKPIHSKRTQGLPFGLPLYPYLGSMPGRMGPGARLARACGNSAAGVDPAEWAACGFGGIIRCLAMERAHPGHGD